MRINFFFKTFERDYPRKCKLRFPLAGCRQSLCIAAVQALQPCKRTRKKTSFKSNEWQVLTRARLIHGFYHSSSLNLLYLLQSLFYILRNQVLLWFKRNVKIFHGKRNPEYSEEELKSYVKVVILFK